jgi:hypothetical protein
MASAYTNAAQVKRDLAVAKFFDIAAQLLEMCKPFVQAAVKKQ